MLDDGRIQIELDPYVVLMGPELEAQKHTDPPDPDPQHRFIIKKNSVLFYVVNFMGRIPTQRVYFRVSSEGLSSGGNLLRLRAQDTPT